MALKYIGNGAAVIGIPAHDLDDDQVERYGGEAFLLTLNEANKPLFAKSAPQKKTGREVRDDDANTDE